MEIIVDELAIAIVVTYRDSAHRPGWYAEGRRCWLVGPYSTSREAARVALDDEVAYWLACEEDELLAADLPADEFAAAFTALTARADAIQRRYAGEIDDLSHGLTAP
jgi:hypothetical protein